MSEFKKTGTYYVSEWNGDSLNDGSALTPFAHPADAPNQTGTVILGTGYYVGNWGVNRYRLIGDGKVIIDGQGDQLRLPSDANFLQENIHFKNASIVGNDPNFVNRFDNCILDKVDVFRCANTGSANRTSYRLVFLSPNINNEILIDSVGAIILSSLFMCSVSIVTPSACWIKDCYLDKSATLVVPDTINISQVTNNLLNGVIVFSGQSYELKLLIDGSPRPDANASIQDLASAPGWSNVYLNGNFAGINPLIIDPVNRVVEANSDLLKKTNTYGFIGSVRPGKKIPVNASDPNITITTTDIDTATDPANWRIQSPATEGFITITWKISESITEVQRIFLDALLSFAGSEAGGSAGNNNVPDNFPASYSPLSQAGLTPNRLLYELRTSQSIGMPSTESEWDNDNVALGTTPGAYYRQEWNTKPTIVTVLGVRYGNGNPESIGGTPNGINARWAQAKIRLTNNRAF
jgi:hypothetical protein